MGETKGEVGQEKGGDWCPPQRIACSLNTDKNTSYISFIAAVFAKH
jgi:hypothetical protein